MVKQEPVNLTRQTIFAVIPFLNLYVFYRIQKLRKYLLILISMYVVINLAITGLVFGILFLIGSLEILSPFLNNLDFLESSQMHAILFAIGTFLNIYLVRRWSKQWNKQLDGNDTDQIPVKEWDN